MQLVKINFTDLNARQKEIYNFQKVAALLADYGFNCIKLADDWGGADFLAYHKDGLDTLKVQLKGRITINRKYVDKDIYMTFPADGSWYLVHHDTLMDIVERTTNWLNTPGWHLEGHYSAAQPGGALAKNLVPYRLGI
jgi:hypothetical protein